MAAGRKRGPGKYLSNDYECAEWRSERNECLVKQRMKLIVALCCTVTIVIAGIVTATGAMGGMGAGMGGGGMGGGRQGGKGGEAEGQQVQKEDILVEAEPVGTGSLELSTKYVGKIEPGRSLEVFPETSGKVKTTYFNVGDAVQKGDLLFEIDSSDLELEAQAAEASYELSRLNIESSLGSTYESSLQQKTSSYENAKNSYKNAVEDLENYKDEGNEDDLEDAKDEAKSARSDALSEYNAVKRQVAELEEQIKNATIGSSQLEDLEDDLDYLKDELQIKEQAYNAADSAYEAAKKAYDGYDDEVDQFLRSVRSASLSLSSAEDSLNLLTEKQRKEDEEKADVQLRQAKISYETTMKKLDKTKVYAPIDGIIESKNLDEFENATTQNAAYTISNKDSMLVSFSVSADSIDSMSIGDPVTVERGSASFPGSIVEIGQKIESSGLLTVKAEVQAGEVSLVNGMTVKVSAATSKAENAIVIPVSAISYEDGQGYVYVVRDGAAVKTAVGTGISNREEIEITEGLDEGDQLVTTWHPDLSDGAAVSVVGESSPSGEEAGSDETVQPQGPQAAKGPDESAPQNDTDGGETEE